MIIFFYKLLSKQTMFSIDLLRLQAIDYVNNEYNNSLSEDDKKILIIDYIKRESDKYFNDY